MSVRALLENYGELITQILPCTLMSPDSVARFFPARAGLFDIVVFDEASQIRVADAVGAMGRAQIGRRRRRQQADAADQLRRGQRRASTRTRSTRRRGASPTRSRSSPSACRRGCRSKWLSWHYRSQDESLIAFSNSTTTTSRLSSFPAPLAGRHRDRGSRHLARPRRRAVRAVRARARRCAPTGSRPTRSSPTSARRFAASPDVVAVDRRHHLQRAAARPHREPAARRRRRPASLQALDEPRRPVRQEPGERAGRRARHHPVLGGVQRERQGRGAAELRPAVPAGRRASTQRRDHPRAPAGGAVRELRPRGAARRGDDARSAPST